MHLLFLRSNFAVFQHIRQDPDTPPTPRSSMDDASEDGGHAQLEEAVDAVVPPREAIAVKGAGSGFFHAKR